jgi:exosortase E/protease (VPEID-CTERM system)
MVVRALAVFAALAVLISARPAPFRRVLARAGDHAGARGAMLLHAAGVVLMFAPLALFGGDGLVEGFAAAAALWIAGGLAAAVGGLLWLAPLAAWRAMARETGPVLPVVVVIAALLPDLAELAYPLWTLHAVTEATFAAVAWLLAATSGSTYADPASYVIGVNDFFVIVSQQCSGVEGFALVTAFCALYAFLFRDTIHPWRFLLVVWPLALLLSWVLNVVRIAALILIGAHVSPDLAVNGFHSYAGWMFFTLLALGLLVVVQAVPWFHRGAPAPAATWPLREDPDAVRILPFVAFMVASVLAGALAAHPDLAYPVKVAAMAGAVAFFWPAYRQMPWAPDPLAAAAGLAVGAAWLWLDPGDPSAGALAAGLAALPAALLAAWIALRVLGTVVLVPLIEEMFFRGYVLARIDAGGLALRIVAIAVSSLAFAALHGRWLEAGAAGVVFALVMLRRGRVTDAVLAHAVANAVVALGALLAGDWTRI